MAGRAYIILGLALALLAFVVAPAGARSERELGEVFVKSATSPTAPSTVVTVDAFCPRGAALVGGGYEAGPVGQEGPFVVGSYRIQGRGWRALGGQGPTPTNASISSYALCQRGARKLKRVIANAAIPPAVSFDTATVQVPVTCPTGLSAVAGGFLGEADPQSGAAIVQASYKNGADAWVNSALNLGGLPINKNFASIAYCSPRDRTAVTQSVGVPPASANAAQPVDVATPPCDDFLQAGGFQVSPPNPNGGPIIPLASRPVNARKPVDQGWHVRAAELGQSGSGSLTAIAYCR